MTPIIPATPRVVNYLLLSQNPLFPVKYKILFRTTFLLNLHPKFPNSYFLSLVSSF